jgi:uncharacterized phage-associated protein
MTFELDSKDVAAYVLSYCKEHGIECNITKLQKLLYCSYGVILAVLEARLTQEHPQAWPYGPVFPRTYKAFTKKSIDLSWKQKVVDSLPDNALRLINATLEFFGQFPAGKLSSWSHNAGSPWSLVSDNGKNIPVQMDDFQIMMYFRAEVVSEHTVEAKDVVADTFR